MSTRAVRQSFPYGVHALLHGRGRRSRGILGSSRKILFRDNHGAVPQPPPAGAQLAQAKAEIAQLQTRAQAAENTVAALTAEIQKHIASINAS